MGIPFDEKELVVVKHEPAMGFFPAMDTFSYPVTEREAWKRTMAHKPVWALTRKETRSFVPMCVPDNVCRGMITENVKFDPVTQAGGKDMFGIPWVYVPQVGGSMEDPNVPHILEDVNDWKDVIEFPDIDSWPWEECAERNKGFLPEDKQIQGWIYTGFFERLISFMGFENAAVALIDDDQQEAVLELMMALADTYCDLVDHYVKYFDHIDSFFCHDDWGTQKAPFFNAEVGRMLFVPAMKKLTDHMKEVGVTPEFHSCGCHAESNIENVIEAGWVCWSPQPMNPTYKLWEKYGDKIVLPPNVKPMTPDTPDEEQIRLADEWVEHFCTTPGKPAFISRDDGCYMFPAFLKELYRKSREAYAEWPD